MENLTKNILQINKVSKSFATHKALSNISLDIPTGSIFGLLGPNGAGKSTLIRTITQIISLDEGTILFNGETLAEKHIPQIGYLPEERGLYKKMKVGEQLMYMAQLRGLSATDAKTKIRDWFARFEISDWAFKNVEDLSKGMQQKVQFIATVLHEPPLLILDEPFTGFDPVNASLIKDEIIRLKNKGTTVIFSTHRMESVEEMCDNIALIHLSQKMLDGKTKDIKNQYKDNSFKIEFTGALENLSENIEILSQISHKEHTEAIIRLKETEMNNTSNNNSLISLLLEKVQLLSFQENIPSINDIFIKIVAPIPKGE